MAVKIRVYIEVIGDTPGGWCPHCALPSAVTLSLVLRSPLGWEYRTIVVCDDCHQPC